MRIPKRKRERQAHLDLSLRCCSGQSLIPIGDDIIHILYSYGEPYEVRSDSCGCLLLDRELLVCGGGWMDHQALRVADIGQVGEELG